MLRQDVYLFEASARSRMMHEYGQILLTAGRFGDPDLQSVLSTQRGTYVANLATVHVYM
jgi:hypothetical protein